jgi:hypothetical protein
VAPRFAGQPLFDYFGEFDVRPSFDSPLIDGGDPAPIEDWQRGSIQPVHGRRDIGRQEYLFSPPTARADIVRPLPTVHVGIPVQVRAYAGDTDLDPVAVRIVLDGEEVIPYRSAERGAFTDLNRTFDAPGTHTVVAVARDPFGLTGQGAVTFEVRPPQISRLSLSRTRFRAARGGRAFATRATGTKISYSLLGRVPVRFTLSRAIVGRRGRILRWRRLRGGFTDDAAGGPNSLRYSGRLNGHRLRPGRFRLTATPRGGEARTARFTIVRPGRRA